MTQVSVTPATPGAAPAASEAAVPVLAQAAQRAEFSARLLDALAALRGGVPAAPAPIAAESPALSAEAAPAPLEETSLELEPALELEAAPEQIAPGDVGTLATPDSPTGFAPLALLRLSRDDDAPEDPSGGEGAPANESAGDPPVERPSATAPPRPASFAPAESLPQPAAQAQPQSPQSEPASDAAARAVDAATAATPARRAERAQSETPSLAPEPAPAPEPALARGPELATPVAQSARSESATPAAGRVLPELPVRNEQEIVDQVRFLLNRRGGQASIELHPPQLGQVGLRIHVTDHAVRLEITADRLQVAELLHRHLPELQHALESQGLQIDRAQVDLRERGGDGRERGGDPGDTDARRGRDFDGEGSPRHPSYPRSALPAYSLGAVDVHA